MIHKKVKIIYPTGTMEFECTKDGIVYFTGDGQRISYSDVKIILDNLSRVMEVVSKSTGYSMEDASKKLELTFP